MDTLTFAGDLNQEDTGIASCPQPRLAAAAAREHLALADAHRLRRRERQAVAADARVRRGVTALAANVRRRRAVRLCAAKLMRATAERWMVS